MIYLGTDDFIDLMGVNEDVLTKRIEHSEVILPINENSLVDGSNL
jgi:hypothetical protein